MKRPIMLDASALLTVLLGEPGEARVAEVLDNAQMHAVNIAEVVARLVRSDVPVADAIEAVAKFQFDVREELPAREAEVIGALMGQHRTVGCSLGDWVCLTSVARAGAIAMTADPKWRFLDGQVLFGMTFEVEVIR